MVQVAKTANRKPATNGNTTTKANGNTTTKANGNTTTKANGNTTAKANGKVKAATKPAKATSSETSEINPEALANKLRLAVKKSFKVTISKREQRIQKKIWYACREKLGLDINSQIKPDKLDWVLWNKLFSAIFGTVDEPKYSVEQMASAMSYLYDTVPTDPDEAIEALVEFNRMSLEKRNNGNGNGKSNQEIEDLIEELEEVEDEDEDDLELDDEEELDEEDLDDDDLDDEDDEDFE